MDNKIPKILQETEDRFIPLPVKYHDLYDQYETAKALRWEEKEVYLNEDRFDDLDKDEQHYLKMVLAFFAASDGIVNENLAVNMYDSVQFPEARCYYAEQMAIENIHAITYARLIQAYITDVDEQNKLFKALNNFTSIRKKADWALEWIDNGTFVEKLLAFACVEGIFFSSSFAAIYWLDFIHPGKLPGLKLANDLISRDEGLHCEFAITLYNNYIEDKFKLSQEKVHSMLLNAFEVEKEFVLESLPVRLIGMNSDLMIQYLKYVVDTLCIQLNVPKIFNVKQPLKFMEQLGLVGKSNFFEKKVPDYMRSGIKDDTEETDDELFGSDF